MSETQILFYGTTWCPDCRRVLNYFDKTKVNYKFIDIDKDKEGRSFVEKTNNGYRSVPTLVFPDGSILVEPAIIEIEQKLNI